MCAFDYRLRIFAAKFMSAFKVVVRLEQRLRKMVVRRSFPAEVWAIAGMDYLPLHLTVS
jgi:hypothetical protein